MEIRRGTAAGERFEEPLQLILITEVDLDAAAGPFTDDAHASAEREFELVLGGAGIGVDLAWRRCGAGCGFSARECLGFADGEGAGDDVAGELALRRIIGDTGDRPGVAHRQRARREVVSDLGGQAQQPQVVGDGRAVFADGGRNRFLRELQFVGQAAIRLRFLDRIQVFALDVFDQRDREQVGVGDVANDDRHLEKACALCGAPAPLASDDLVTAVDQAHEDRLNDAVAADRLRELFEPPLIDLLARLPRVGGQPVEVDFGGL